MQKPYGRKEWDLSSPERPSVEMIHDGGLERPAEDSPYVTWQAGHTKGLNFLPGYKRQNTEGSQQESYLVTVKSITVHVNWREEWIMFGIRQILELF